MRREEGLQLPSKPVWQSRTAGDIVLATLPPYMAMGWLAMGIPLLSALLEQMGISSRIVRFGNVPHDAPPDILDLQDATLWSDPPLPVRLSKVQAAVARNREFLDSLLSRLLAGPERVFGFSIWRLNVDVTLEVARQLKERRPDALIVFGGPETAEAPGDLQHEWVDVVVKGSAEGVIGPVVRALLDRRPVEAAMWDNVWVNPTHGTRGDQGQRHGEAPPIPRIDYTRIVPLQVGAPRASIPVLMNLGCPFRCGFCTNTTIYPEIGWGSPHRVVEEMVEIMRVWNELHPVDPPPLEITICDAALNARPAQFDELCKAMIAADWPLRPGAVVTQVIMDKRMTPSRVKLTMDADLNHSFFGLESANPRIRRVMKKPGQKEEIAQALQVCSDHGWDGLNFGIIVGWPDETEAEFLETVEFLDWAASLGIMRALSVIPMYRTQGMMDESLLRGAEGEAKGLAWRLPTAAGSPAVRARRYFHIFEHFSGFTLVQSPVPHRVVVSEMLGGQPSGFWERWIANRGEHPIDNRQAETPSPSALSAEDNGQPREELIAEDPIVGETIPSDLAREPWDETPGSSPESHASLHSERRLVGRGVAVTLRLNPDASAGALATVHAHGFSYVGEALPTPLRDVVLELGRAVGELNHRSQSTEEIWEDVARLVETIAPDVHLA